jgi:transcriptional regulator with XRE-family HTH domain
MTTTVCERIPALEALRVNVITGRARARLSQEELAQRASLSRPTVSRIERAAGDIGIEVVQRIADALGVTVSALFLPLDKDEPDDCEIVARLDSGDDEFLDAASVLDAIDEASEREPERYSRAGRPRVER